METLQKTQNHTITIDNQSKATITGVQEVVSATEKGVLLKLSNCSMQIAGENIRVEKLSPEEKILILVGKVFEVKYSSATAKTSFFKKMFR